LDDCGYEILRLRLVNFAHFTSLGLSDFEIDRRGSNNSIILLVGGNGSGKSLLATAWTPRAHESTNNRRRSLIEEGMEGIKELDIVKSDKYGKKDDYMYRCRIVYTDTSTNCSMIKVDRITGESMELNPNGLVSSYDALLVSEFGISKNYSNIGYLSPQITSLVAMKPGPRYEYISTFLPDITKYMDAFKHVSKKINSLSRQIKMLENDIGDISIEKVTRDKEMLSIKRTSIQQELKKLEDMRSKLSMVHGRLVGISRMEISNKISIIKSNRTKMNKNYEFLQMASTLSINYSGKSGKKKLEKELILLENDIKNLITTMENDSRSLDDKRMRLKDLEYSLGMLNDTNDSLPDISAMIDRLNDSIDKAHSTIDMYKSSYDFISEISKNFTINEYNIVSNAISNIHDRISRITDQVPLDKLENIGELSDLNGVKITSLMKGLKSFDDKISSTLEKITLLKSTPLDPSILDHKPDFCDALKCGIIKEIHRLLSPDTEVLKLQVVLSKLYEDKSKVQLEIDLIENESNNIFIALNYLNDINHSLMRDKDYFVFLPSKMRELLNNQQSLFSNIEIILRDLEIIKDYILVRDQFNTYNSEIIRLKEKESSLKFVRNINSDVNRLNNEIENTQLAIKTNKSKLVEMGETLNSLSTLYDNLENINQDIDQYNVYANQFNYDLEKMNKIVNDCYHKELIGKGLNKLEMSISRMIFDLETINREVSEMDKAIITKQSLIEMRDRLIKQIKDVEVLHNTWNPKTGIPSFFINNFLNRIHKRSNEYLESLNGKDLIISKFEIGTSAREFPIIVEKNGKMIPDASQCSEGQIALISLAVSMAMIKEAVKDGGYNVIRMDEMDAALDHIRRKLYVEMIQDRLSEINSKQCLVITHSSEFNDIPADIILFPGSYKNPELLANKNVLLDLTHIPLDSING